MFSISWSLLCFSSILLSSAHALIIPLKRSSTARWPLEVSKSSSAGQKSYGFSNYDDDTYTGTVYIQGHPFQVVLDTGSSDLWVQTTGITLDGLIDTQVADEEDYGTPEDPTFAKGYIALANVTFGPYTITNQAMMNAVEGNVTKPWYQGIIGISSPPLSEVTNLLSNHSEYVLNSKPFLINLFEQDSTIPPYYALHLSRWNGTTGAIEGGSFAIGEVISGWAGVLKAPQLPVVTPYGWFTNMDGIHIGDKWIDGGHVATPLPLWQQPSSTQSLVLLDSGTSLVAANPFLVDAIFKNLSGAVFSEDYSMYQIPCNTKLNVSVTFAGVSYPINPLDMIVESLEDDGSIICYGTWQYAINAGQDAIFGDVFLRNVYSVFNYGNWTDNHNYGPFLQLLSITNQEQALEHYDQLHAERMAQIKANATIAGSSTALAGTQTQTWAFTTAQSTPTASCAASHVNADVSLSGAAENASGSDDSAALVRNEYIIMGLLGGALVLLIAILVKLVQNGRNKQYRQVPTNVPVFNDKPYGE